MKTELSVSDASEVTNHATFPWLILITILFAPLITIIDVFIINVSLPSIQTFFHASNAAVQGIVAAYLVGYAVFLITGSRAGDHFGRKKIFIIGLFVFTLASALCGYAGSIEQLIIFRFLQGVSAGFAAPQTVTLIQLNFKHGSFRNKALGYYGITAGIAAVIGQFLGGYLVTSHLMHEPWRLIFLINVPLGLIAVVMAAMFIPESKLSKKTNFDMGGVFLLTAGLTSLIYPIIEGRELGWPAWTIVLFFLSIVILYFFVRYQYRRISLNKSVLMPMHLFKIRSFNLGLGMVSLYFALFSSFLLTCALFLQEGHHVDPLTSATYFVVLGVMFMFSSYWSIKNVQKYGTSILQIACLSIVAAFLIQFIWFKDSLPLLAVLASFSCYGLGAGMLVPSFLKIALKVVPHDQAGIASGIYSTVQQFSSAFGVSVLAGVYFFVAHQQGGVNGAYHVVLLCLIAFIVAVMFLLFFYQRLSKATAH